MPYQPVEIHSHTLSERKALILIIHTMNDNKAKIAGYIILSQRWIITGKVKLFILYQFINYLSEINIDQRLNLKAQFYIHTKKCIRYQLFKCIFKRRWIIHMVDMKNPVIIGTLRLFVDHRICLLY